MKRFTFSASTQACSITESCAPQPTNVISLPSRITWISHFQVHQTLCTFMHYRIIDKYLEMKRVESIPLLVIEATWSHPPELLQLPNGKATEDEHSRYFHLNFWTNFDPNNLQKLSRIRNTLGSKNITGFSSRMHESSNPLAWYGLRGMTTCLVWECDKKNIFF